jgi:plastocyanin
MRIHLPAAALIVLALSPDPATAGIVRGVLHVPATPVAAPAALTRYPGQASSMPGAHCAVRGSVDDAVVYVESVPAVADSSPAPSAPRPRLAQKDQAFVPRVLPVAAGTTVDFPNLDPIYHNVFSPSPLKRFDLGKYPHGHSKSVTFDRAGLVHVYCDIHSEMEAFVLVLPHHGFTQPDAAGAFALPPLPGGRYVLRVWHPDLGEIRREVDVPDDGERTLDLSF